MTMTRPARLLLLAITALAALLICNGNAQLEDRSKLVEPVYVSKSNDLNDLASKTPMLETSTLPTQPGTRPELEKEAIKKEIEEQKQVAAAAPPPPAADDPCLIFARVLADAQTSLDHIQSDVEDYTCTFIKREFVNGQIIGPQQIKAKVRNQKVVDGQVVVPFSVFMKFEQPTAIRGRQVLYVEGRNKGKLHVKEGGTTGRFLPAVKLPVDCRIVMKDQRYPITEFGIENLTQRLIDRGSADQTINKCKVTYKEGAKVCGRVCRFMEVRRDVPKADDELDGGMNVFLARVFIDQELNVPIRYAAYDWPKNPGESPTIVEEYTYCNLKLNVGLTDHDFDPDNKAYNF